MNPYEGLESKAFWKPAVGQKHFYDIEDIWSPRFTINKDKKLATYGSCFAQHLSRALANSGYNWFNAESAPNWISKDVLKEYNYGVFSARTGNIYTSTLFLQWVNWALEVEEPPLETWEKDGRFYDPFRPIIEPNGFKSKEEVYASRNQTIKAFRDSILESKYLVFTLGLTESWRHKTAGYEYPMCPGTVAGTFDQSQHEFVDLSFSQCFQALKRALQRIKQKNKKLKVLLTVSPVPLTATNSGKHVLVATSSSKSRLRAVADEAVNSLGYVDYFPSYETITAPPYKGVFFEPNLRSVNSKGVEFVMSNFFQCLHSTAPEDSDKEVVEDEAKAETRDAVRSNDDVKCEEELLDAFGGNK